MTDSPDIVAILRRVPEVHLRAFDLAEHLRTPDGLLDVDRAGLYEAELNVAQNEASFYSQTTTRAITVLHALLLK